MKKRLIHFFGLIGIISALFVLGSIVIIIPSIPIKLFWNQVICSLTDASEMSWPIAIIASTCLWWLWLIYEAATTKVWSEEKKRWTK